MENDFRKRILAPVLLLLGLAAGIAIFAFSISRVLLAVPEIIATITALALAAYVLFLAVMVGKRTAITGRALGVGLAIALIAVVSAGVISAQAGMRDLHAEEEGGEGVADEGGEGEEGATAEIPSDALLWVAVDIDYEQEVTEAAAGEQVIAIDNQGNLPHNVVFEGTDIKVEAEGGQTASATVTLEPGSYTFFCDVPGHRASMEGTIEVN
jgi:plastocyanin